MPLITFFLFAILYVSFARNSLLPIAETTSISPEIRFKDIIHSQEDGRACYRYFGTTTSNSFNRFTLKIPLQKCFKEIFTLIHLLLINQPEHVLVGRTETSLIFDIVIGSKKTFQVCLKTFPGFTLKTTFGKCIFDNGDELRIPVPNICSQLSALRQSDTFVKKLENPFLSPHIIHTQRKTFQRRLLDVQSRCYKADAFDIDSCLYKCKSLGESEWDASLISFEYDKTFLLTKFLYQAETNKTKGECTKQNYSSQMNALYFSFNGCCNVDIEQVTIGMKSNEATELLHGGWAFQATLAPGKKGEYIMYVNGKTNAVPGTVCIRGENNRCACKEVLVPNLCNIQNQRIFHKLFPHE